MDSLDRIVYSSSTAAGAGERTISWRTGYLSDWTLALGDRRFQTHRTILARGSEVLAASMESCYQASSTDLTQLLPQNLHSIVELILDEIYEGSAAVDDTQVILMFAATDILGMKTAFIKLLAVLKEKICCQASSLASMLHDIRELPQSNHLKHMQAAICESVARRFGAFRQHCSGGYDNIPF